MDEISTMSRTKIIKVIRQEFIVPEIPKHNQAGQTQCAHEFKTL